MTRLYEDFLLDIADGARDILEFVKGLTFEEFEHDKKTIYAVVRALEILEKPPRIYRKRFGYNMHLSTGRKWQA